MAKTSFTKIFFYFKKNFKTLKNMRLLRIKKFSEKIDFFEKLEFGFIFWIFWKILNFFSAIVLNGCFRDEISKGINIGVEHIDTKPNLLLFIFDLKFLFSIFLNLPNWKLMNLEEEKAWFAMKKLRFKEKRRKEKKSRFSCK